MSGVYDNLSRAEAILRNMEEKTGCVRRSLQTRRAVRTILDAASKLLSSDDQMVRDKAEKIVSATRTLEE